MNVKKIVNEFSVKMLIKPATILMTCSLLAACGTPVKQEDTLANLKKRNIVIKPQALSKANKEAAQKTYKRFATSTKNQVLRAQAMERLADLELERKLEEKLSEVERKERLAEAREGRGDVIYDPSGLEDYAQVAIQYEKLLRRYPKSTDNEQIMYQLARAYDLSGQMDKSLKIMTRLVAEFPDTKYIEEVNFRRGEILFSKKSYVQAQKSYKKILSNPDSPFYQRALYKMGWALFKERKLDQSIITFYRLLDLHFKSGKNYDSFSRSQSELVDDTLRVVSLAYSFQDGTKSIQKMSKKLGFKSYESQIYRRLSELYIDQERYDDAANTYSAFVKAHPNNRQSPLFMVRVIEIYKTAAYGKALTTAKADFVTRYGVNNAFWQKHDRQLFNKVSPYIREHLEDLARHYHSKAQKSKKTSDYKVAAHWYKEFVQSFPGDAKTPELNFLLAEIYNETKQYELATEEYIRTSYDYAIHDHSAEAGYAAILSEQKVIEQLEGNRKTAKRHEATKLSLRFTDKYPGNKHTPTILLKTAQELLDLGQLGDAGIIAKRVIELPQPKLEKLKASAWAIIAKSEFDLGRYEKAEYATLRRLDFKTETKERAVHLERLAASIYKQGEAAKEVGQLEAAAAHFLRIGKLAPDSKIRATADFDAAAMYAEQKKWSLVIPVLKSFVRNFPAHKFVSAATEKLAFAYEQQGELAKAANTYENIYGNEQDVQRKRDLLWQTAELYEKSKRQTAAIKVYEKFILQFPEPLEQAMEARLRVADAYKDVNQVKKRHYWLNEIIKADAAAESTERSKYLAAKATLELAEPVFQSYRQVHLVQPLKANLKKKKAIMQKSIAAYTSAAEYGVAEVTTASTYRIAEIYSDFSRVLLASERPAGLSSTELEQYELLLEEQVFPFEEKAIEIHETNANRVVAGLYDEWVKKSFLALQKLNPIRYAKLERSEPFDLAIK